MVNIIITGHGNFATGLKSALELIAGEQKQIVALDFLGDDDGTKLMKELKQITKENSTLIYTDLYGGTPFRLAFKLAYENDQIGVVAGTNLGMLLEILPSLGENISIGELLNLSEESYQDHYKKFVKDTDN